MILSANQAAKEAGKTKKTILDAIKSGRLSASKNDKGHWDIDPSELFRVFPRMVTNHTTKTDPNHHDMDGKHPEHIRLQVEVEALRDKLATSDEERTRERQQLTDQIEKLEKVNEDQRADFRQSLAALTDQRDKHAAEGPQKPVGWFDRMLGRVG